jgi:hypothetical protein
LNLLAISLLESGTQSALTKPSQLAAACGPPEYGRKRRAVGALKEPKPIRGYPWMNVQNDFSDMQRRGNHHEFSKQ